MLKGLLKRGRYLWQCYEHELETRPLLTKCWMSATILGCADTTAQLLNRYVHKSDEGDAGDVTTLMPPEEIPCDPVKFDWQRAGAVQAYAWCFQGPFGHVYVFHALLYAFLRQLFYSFLQLVPTFG